MGIFSSKKKTYVGISNSRLYEGKEIPNSIKDSTAGYIRDIGDGLNGDNYITDYNNLSMQSSIVSNLKRATNYVNKRDKHNYNKLDATQKSIKEPVNLEVNIRKLLLTTLPKYFKNPEINYIEYNYLDISHIVKVILDIEYGWNSFDNTMFYNGLTGWLYSVDIHLKEVQEEPRLGNSFASGETATRPKDTSRPYRPFIYEQDGLPSKRNKFVFKFMPKYTKTYRNITKEYKDKTTNAIVNTDSKVIDVIDNKPIGESATIYKNSKEVVSETIYADPTNSNIEIKETTEDSNELSYGTLKQKTLYLENFLDTIPDELPVIDGESIVPTSQAVKDYIASVENNFNEDTVNFNDLIVSVSVTVNGNENKHFSFGNKDTHVDGLKGDIARGLYALIGITNLTGYVADIHLKQNNKVASKLDDDWRTNNLYAKKLSIKLKGLYEKLTESMENDEDKIRHAYITFGVNVHSSIIEDLKYLYQFFNDELQDKSSIDTKEIVLSTRTTSEAIKWDSISKTIVNEALLEDYVNLSFGSNIILLKKINPTQHERIEINNYKRYCRVTGGNQVGVLSDLFDGKWGETAKDSTTLLPFNMITFNKVFKSFIEKERFIYRCMYVEFLTYVVVKVKWYQRGAFKLVAIALGAAIIYFTGGAGSYWSALLVSAATSVAIDFAIRITVRMFGAKWGRAIGIALAIIGMGKGIGGALAATGQTMVKVLGAFLSNAQLYISLANGFLNQSLQTIGIERQEEMDEKNRELVRLKEMAEVLLGSRVNDKEYQVDRNYLSSYIYLGTMEAYLDSILDLNKIDTCIDYIHNCTEYLISLPTLDESASSILGLNQ